MDTKIKKISVRNPKDPILFVDDDPIIHKIMEDYLKNWQVTYAYSAQEALEILKEQDFSIVITDLNMPEMSGIDLFREIKSIHGVIQVIITTASEQGIDLMRCLEAGVNDFLLKPFKQQNVEGILYHTLERIHRWKLSFKKLAVKKKKE